MQEASPPPKKYFFYFLPHTVHECQGRYLGDLYTVVLYAGANGITKYTTDRSWLRCSLSVSTVLLIWAAHFQFSFSHSLLSEM